MNIQVITLTAVLMATLTGCQGFSAFTSHGLDNTGFMTTWETYQHCEQSSDIEAMREDALRLARIARETLPLRPAVPSPLKQYVSDPPHRLAVEPASMAASCGLHAAQTAFEAGRFGVADEMYRLVLAYSEQKFPYYVSQARTGLDLITHTIQPQVAQGPMGPALAD